MSASPDKKRIKIQVSNDQKRPNESGNTPSKRIKNDVDMVEESREKKILALKRKNFITACERVSYEAYFDHKLRFQLIYNPICLANTSCKHIELKHGKFQVSTSEMPGYAEESFKIEVKTHMWCEALEVCQLCITPQQYLSANVLKDIVEIILNAHEDEDAGYTISSLIKECQQILSQNFCSHPPCLNKSIRKCYNKFLTSPMSLRDGTFTNRTEFGYDKGIVKYCMNRLQYEVSCESQDGPLLDKMENIPNEMKQSVKGLHWQKEKFEIFELLDRSERIQRLMTVLESIIELLGFDLAIWHSRHTSNQGRHIMRSHKPLMAYVLWSDNVLYTGAVNNNCRQILRLFVLFIHLGYPASCVKIMTRWLNTIIQTFYICEANSNSDYPNTGKYCSTFAKEFYKIIAELPNDSIIKVMEAIRPTYMMYLVGIQHLKSLLSTKEDDILKIMIEFVKKSRWKDFSVSNESVVISGMLNFHKPVKAKRKLRYLLKKVKNSLNTESKPVDNFYPREVNDCVIVQTTVDQNHVVRSLYVTLLAYLDAYSVQDVQEKLEMLNDKVDQNDNMETDGEKPSPDECAYTVSEHFIKKYRSIYQLLQELVLLFEKVKIEGKLPEILNVFEHVGLLGL